MSKNIGIVPGERLAGLMIDILAKYRAGAITEDEIAHFTQFRNPFHFDRNEHGHIIVKVPRFAFSGREIVARMKHGDVGYWTHHWSFFTTGAYDELHRCEWDHYMVVLVPASRSDMVEANVRNVCLDDKYQRQFGYSQPQAGILVALREIISDTTLTKMGFNTVRSYHEPIRVEGELVQLEMGRTGSGRWINPVPAYTGPVVENSAIAYVVERESIVHE